MRAAPAQVGAVVVDSLAFSQGGTLAQAQGLAKAGVHGVAVYLGVVNAERVGHVLAAGMGCFAVTLAGSYNNGAADEIAQLKALGFPLGKHVFLDMEGMAAYKSDPLVLISKVNEWADGIRAAGYKPALYVGVPQPLTAAELWKLKVELYWRGQGCVRDRHGDLAEPYDVANNNGCGWSITQKYPSRNLGTPATWVDMNMVGQDYKGRVPIWAVA